MTKHAASPLVERWFHSFTADGLVEWQGTIVAQVTADTYLLQLFEWLLGNPTVQKLVPLSSMLGWEFYDSGDEMRDFYRTRHAARAERAGTP